MILGPIRNELLAPDRIDRMAMELQMRYVEQLRRQQQEADEAPAEIVGLDARTTKLRYRQRIGDPDMTFDELQVIVDRLLTQRSELERAQPIAKRGAKIASMLPRAAALYKQQIVKGLGGDARAALKARAVLRKLCGAIVLEAGDDGSLWANFDLQPAALLAAGGTSGRGERI